MKKLTNHVSNIKDVVLYLLCDWQVATLLLNKDADPNVLIPTHGVTPFHLVIGNDSEEFAEEVTKLFLRHGGDPNVRSNDGMTPVHVAAAWGRINILQLLLTNGGDPLCLDNDGRSPFHYAFDGKYFKAVTMLSNHCESIQDEDDKPKYNMVLDKVLITNGDIIAEYVASKDTVSNLDNMTMKNVLTDYEYSSRAANTMTAQLQNNLVWTDKKEVPNYSFIDLDFDFANLHLSDVMQKEKCLVSQIINHLSSSLASDCTMNETLHNCKRNKCKESSIAACDSDMPFEVKKDVGAHHKYYKNLKDYPYKLQHTSNKNILERDTTNVRGQYSKYSAQNPSRKQYKKNTNEIAMTPCYVLDNSIVSMSPNFNTPNHRKRKNTAKTPLTPSYINNDSIVSKSPNFTTPVCTTRKRNLAKTSHTNDHSSTNVFKKLREYATQTQYSELNWQKKHIAQSTPRRKKRSMYKFLSGKKKRFNSYRYESDVTSDEFTAGNKLKPVDLNKTIFMEGAEDTRYDILDTSSECSSLNIKKSSKIRFLQDHCNNHLVTKLNQRRYDEDGLKIIISDNSESNLLDNSFNQIEKENKSVNNFNNVNKYTKFENYQVNTEFVTVRRDIFKIDKTPEITDAFTNNIKSIYTTESDMLHRENFIDCVDCDTKKLLNEDLDMNISKTCNLHAKNWCNNEFHEPHKLIKENNSLPTVNLPIQCKKQIYLLDSERSSSKLENNTDSKKMENIPKVKSLDMYKIETNSSMLSYVSTQEYKYEDPEEGVILLERRLCITPFR
ncbi:ankyrin repeat and lem domain-containing protein 1 [Lasius niger]|uniref:Ankyrin repeat and lem domain-containing protein 1 n=1 Tax=Lasius niger TaxID=67767 RepID=A0A0J7KVV9_LASNI|nr:ankyrin repeat and lem domain-containing protein 1 [Lasius niger]